MRMSSVWGRWGRRRRLGGGTSPAVAPPGLASPRSAHGSGGNGNGNGTATNAGNGNGRPAAVAAAAATEHVAVLLDPGLESVAAALREELGPGFAVVIWPPVEPVEPPRSVIAVLDASADPGASMTVASQRRRHPRAGMLVVASRTATASTWQATAELLDAGADDVLTELNTRELAAHLKALARRRSDPARSFT